MKGPRALDANGFVTQRQSTIVANIFPIKPITIFA